MTAGVADPGFFAPEDCLKVGRRVPRRQLDLAGADNVDRPSGRRRHS